MGIKAGSGKGSVDAGGSKKEVPGGVGSSNRRKRPSFPPPPPKKPLQPTADNPFPEKKDFRLGQYRVLEERDDYLLCTGFDPNAKNPFSEVTPSAFRTGSLLKIAKPPALQRTIWEAAPVTINGIAYTYTYSDSEFGVRTVTWTDPDDGDLEEEQRIEPPYTLSEGLDIIIAAQIRKSAAVDGMEVEDEEGTRLRWIDLNVSGRHWKAEATTADEQTHYDAELTSSMAAASDSKTGATTATADLLIPDPGNPGDLMVGSEITVTNRSVDSTGVTGDYIIVIRIGDEWRLIWIDC
jgi:hypothetical protein